MHIDNIYIIIYIVIIGDNMHIYNIHIMCTASIGDVLFYMLFSKSYVISDTCFSKFYVICFSPNSM